MGACGKPTLNTRTPTFRDKLSLAQGHRRPRCQAAGSPPATPHTTPVPVRTLTAPPPTPLCPVAHPPPHMAISPPGCLHHSRLAAAQGKPTLLGGLPEPTPCASAGAAPPQSSN